MIYLGRARSKTNGRDRGAGGNDQPLPPSGSPPEPTGDLAAAVLGMTVTRTELFDGPTLNAQYWNILGESGTAPAGAIGPVIAFADHWGNYLHDPLLVTIANGVLKCGWRKSGNQWYAGGITSAAQYGTHTSAKWQHTFGVVRARVKAPAPVVNSFYAWWSMPVENAFGAWPASGEIDMCEGTNANVISGGDVPICYSNIIHPNHNGANACNSGALTNPTVDFRDGQFHEIACWRRKVGDNVVFDFFFDNRRYGSKTINVANSPIFERPFYDLFTAQLGWWGVGTPTDDMALTTWECDWMQWYAPTTTPPSNTKPTEAPILQAKGLSLVWQDRVGESGGPASDWDFFQATQGSRNANDPTSGTGYSFPSENNQRLSFATYDNKPCMKVTYPANAHGWLNYRSQHLPTHYRELGLCVDIKFPAGYDLRNTVGAAIGGKTMFGLTSGPADHHKPGYPVRPSDTRWPEDQYGASHGINWKYDPATPNVVKFEWYPHVVGAVVGGTYRWRVDNYSRLHYIPGYPYSDRWDVPIGVWHRFELYGRMDTNKGNGLLQAYLNGNLVREATNLDLGGWFGDRGLRARSTGNGTNGDGSISAGTGSLAGTAGGNHKFVGIFMRDMIGGSTSLASNVPLYGGAYYAYNWRVYARL